MEQPIPSRRQFLSAVANLASAGWITMNWPQIAFAAEHAGHEAGSAPTAFTTLTAAEAAEIDAICNQIVPGGDKPGARDCRVIYFIDNALGSFWAAQLASLREGLADFESAYGDRFGTGTNFSAASDAQQIAWLRNVDETPFFLAVRRLTILGMIALPKYGGNHEYAGWNLLGVENRHFWTAPFGYYDQDYAGFVPHPGTQPFTA